MKIYHLSQQVVMISLLLTASTAHPAPAQTPIENNNPGRIVSYFLRDVLGGIIGLKAGQNNPEIAAASLQQVLNGMAGVVELVLEEQKTRGILTSIEEFEKIIIYLQTIISNALATPEGQESFALFLKELKELEASTK